MAKADWKGRESFLVPSQDEPLESLSFRERGGGVHLCLMQRDKNDISFAVNNFNSCSILGHVGSAAKQASLYDHALPFWNL